ncbi:MAG: protein kinase domain-containing protein [Ktedonobacteraceae bacterium]
MLTSTEELPGQIIGGYRLSQVLGRGGMSVVFLGQSINDPHIQVAVKVLKPSKAAGNNSFQARFMREVSIAYQLRQEHIIPVLSYGETDGLAYMIMPFMAGGTLTSRFAQRDGGLPFAEIAHYLNQIASALDYAHQHGVVHRDIKPSNVLLDGQGNIYLADFGIACLYEVAPNALLSTPTSLTGDGEMVGTPAYIAPERFLGEQAGPAADIYALGIMLYFLVTGRVVFQAGNPLSLGMKHLYEAPLAPRALRPDLPEPAEKAILRALAKKPVDRFASAGALAQAFESGVRKPLSTRPVAMETTRSGRGWRMLLAGLVTTGLLLLALFLALLPGGPAGTLPASHALFPPSSRWQQLPDVGSNGTAQLHSVPFGDGSVTITAKNNTVYATRDSSGSLLWKQVVNGQVVPAPVVAGQVIYTVTTTGIVYASQGSNGRLLWSYNTGHPVNKPLVIANGVVYVQTSDGFVYELHASDGRLLDVVALTPGSSPTSPSGGTPVPGTTPAGGVTPTPTAGITATPTSEVTPTPTSEVTPTPTSEVTPTPTSGVTPTPTSGVTPTPTSGVTPAPTSGITPTPTSDAAPSPTPVVTPTSGVTPTRSSSTPGASPGPTGTPDGD